MKAHFKQRAKVLIFTKGATHTEADMEQYKSLAGEGAQPAFRNAQHATEFNPENCDAVELGEGVKRPPKAYKEKSSYEDFKKKREEDEKADAEAEAEAEDDAGEDGASEEGDGDGAGDGTDPGSPRRRKRRTNAA